jgi:hypothetical protein
MGVPDLPYIRPLHEVEHHFLQVLVTRFRLERRTHGGGAHLFVDFDGSSPAVWQRGGRDALRKEIPDFADKVEEHGTGLTEFFGSQEPREHTFDDPDFPFRYGNGGALPIVRLKDRDYYCLIYREVFPIGWNIANGGTDSRDELTNPLDVIERELREELIIIDRERQVRYIFEGDGEQPLDRPEHAAARRIIQKAFPQLNFDTMHTDEAPLKWERGPDQMTVGENSVSGVYLNINAEDFGIEIDRIARIHMNDSWALFDGEINDGYPLNAPIGLFEVSRLSQEYSKPEHPLDPGAVCFVPDLFFYGGEPYQQGAKIDDAIRDFVERLLRDGIITPEQAKEWEECEHKLDLCPVTRRIISRHLEETDFGGARKASITHRCDVFISCASEDSDLADRIFMALSAAGKTPWLFTRNRGGQPWSREIDEALDSATSLVAVGSTLQNLSKEPVEYEWRSFFQDITSGLKSRAQLVPFVHREVDPYRLPRPLRYHEVVRFDPSEIDSGIQTLRDRIGR